MAAWVTDPANRRFERAIANRVWGLLFGRSYNEPVDDLPDPSDENLCAAHDSLAKTRPTAINLPWALKRVADALRNQPREKRASLAWKEAAAIADEDAAMCESA